MTDDTIEHFARDQSLRIQDLEAERDRLLAACAEMRGALAAIRDHKPDFVDGKIDHDTANCPDCKRMKNHPISNGLCNEWYHLHYKIQDKRKGAENREQWQMRSIARQALSSDGSGYAAVVEAAHFLLTWTYQDAINVDEMPSRGFWKVGDLHPGVWNKMNAAEQDLYHKLLALDKGDGHEGDR